MIFIIYSIYYIKFACVRAKKSILNHGIYHQFLLRVHSLTETDIALPMAWPLRHLTGPKGRGLLFAHYDGTLW